MEHIGKSEQLRMRGCQGFAADWDRATSSKHRAQGKKVKKLRRSQSCGIGGTGVFDSETCQSVGS